MGPGVVFTNDRYPRSQSTDWEPPVTTVGRGASIGANATVIGGTAIGEYALVGAASVVTRAVVTRAVADHELVFGNRRGTAAGSARAGAS